MKIKFELNLKEELIINALCSGIEGGINYWCRKIEFEGEERVENIPASWRSFPHYIAPLRDGSITVWTYEDDKSYKIDAESIKRALIHMAENYSRHFGDLAGDNGDALTGDILIQLAAFGGVVYG